MFLAKPGDPCATSEITETFTFTEAEGSQTPKFVVFDKGVGIRS